MENRVFEILDSIDTVEEVLGPKTLLKTGFIAFPTIPSLDFHDT